MADWDDETIDLTTIDDLDNPFASPSTISTAGVKLQSIIGRGLEAGDSDIEDNYEDESSYEDDDDKDEPEITRSRKKKDLKTANDKYAERRKYELSLVQKYDAHTINNRRLCWFLVDSEWLSDWASFVSADTLEEREAFKKPPCKVSNMNLFERGKKKTDDLGEHVEGMGLELKANLEKIRDYRGVSPVVWFIYVYLYGVDPAGAICRCEIDHLSSKLTTAEQGEELRGCELKAKVEVMRMRTMLGDEEKGGYRKGWRPGREEEKVLGIIPRWTADWVFERMFFCCREGPGTKYGRLVNEDGDDSDDEDYVEDPYGGWDDKPLAPSI